MKLKNVSSLLALLVAAALATGCSSSKQTEMVTDDMSEMLKARDAQIKDLESQLHASEQAATRAVREASEAQNRAQAAESNLSDYAASGQNAAAEPMLLPENAVPGECYARVLIPPVYETREERVLLREASTKVETVPARFENVREDVIVKEASEKLEVVPATYEWVEKKVMTKPASKELREVPAVYETVSEKVLVTPERTYWKKGRGLIEKVDNSTGEVMCLVKEPAVYKTVSKRVLKSEAGIREIEIPAEYKTVRRQVVKTPATTRVVNVPAVYESVEKLELAEPARELRTPIAAEYGTVQKRRMVEESRLEWRSVLCETNMTQSLVSELQRALANQGFDPGPIDGIYGSRTQAALTGFQKSKGMASGGLTYAAVEALGIEIR